jgi:hypothetical protein
MLEQMLPGWLGKLMVLGLLGFASTDFVITMTLSSADAAQHMIENPLLHGFIGEARFSVTMVLLTLLAIVFLAGFKEAIGVAMAVGIPYLLLNLVVVARGTWEILQHPDLLSNWTSSLRIHYDWAAMLFTSTLVFPKLALGLSGFETGVSVMPLIKGEPSDPPDYPIGRILATRRLLASAAIIMSVMLLTTSFITTILIPEQEYQKGGPAAGRALAYLTHNLMGEAVGTVYDISTILILWFAGASAMTGMLNLIPRYLPRFGMAPHWVSYSRPLVLVLFAINLAVTTFFRADVEAQAGAYATGVLTLMLSAAVAVALQLWRDAQKNAQKSVARSLYFWAVAGVILFTLVDNVITRPDGVIIATIFTVTIIALSLLSRYLRSRELRVERIVFADAQSAKLWPELVGKKANLVPIKHHDQESRQRKVEEILDHYKVMGPLAFLHVHLADDRSTFTSTLHMKVQREGDHYVVDVTGAVAIANTIAYISECMDPIRLFLGLTRRNHTSQAIKYLLFGEGETGILVYEILVRYWDWTPEGDVRPLIFLMSE